MVSVIAAIGRTGGICATESWKHVGLPCFLYRPTHAPTDAEIERQSQDKRPQGLDTRTSPPCEAKTRRMEQLSWSNGTRIAEMLWCEPSMRMDFSLAPNRREVRRPKVRKLIRMKCCILFDSCIFFDRLKRSLNSVWSVSVISSPWRRTFDEEAILNAISLMIAAKCATLSCWITPAYACRLELFDPSPFDP